jgi:regulation of enolase protein 1 (concanavalin A-like superfamily)
MIWYNEPPHWEQQEDRLLVQAGPQTDFWRLTKGGDIRDNGHFYAQNQEGDFMAEVKISAEYVMQYNHAGLMVRVDEQHWLKCGVEYVGEEQKASAVVTRVYSDWSVAPLPLKTAALWLRVVREGTTFTVFYALDGIHYQMLREAYLPATTTVEIGPMCASAAETSFTVTFEGFNVQRTEQK